MTKRRLVWLILLVMALATVASPPIRTLLDIGAIDGPVSLVLLPFDETIYAHGYSHSAFRKVRAGMGEREVRQLLGDPLGTRLVFDEPLELLRGRKTIYLGRHGEIVSPELPDKSPTLLKHLPPPTRIQWWYSDSPHPDVFGSRARAIVFARGEVIEVLGKRYGD